MISGFQSLCVPTYHLLTPEQIKSIHTATLELLETVGVDVHHDEARQMTQPLPHSPRSAGKPKQN